MMRGHSNSLATLLDGTTPRDLELLADGYDDIFQSVDIVSNYTSFVAVVSVRGHEHNYAQRVHT